jgi:tetratricopeptide (TPR) repeat protein
VKTALLLMVAVGLSSCRHADVHDALLRAEALMETDPHAARAVLDSLSDHCSLITDHFSQRDAALYALLKTQADYKCNVRLTSDSLPLVATNYYGTKRKTQHAALAQHYLGCTYLDIHRDLDAIEAQLRATTLFPDTTNKYFANSLFELGLLYSKHYMVDSAWVAFGRYRRTEACNSDSVNIGYADYYMGALALYHDDDELTDSLFQCVLNNTKTTNYNRFTTYFQLAKLRFYHQHDTEGALAYLEKTGNYFGEENSALLMLKADILAQQQQPATAYEYYKKALQNTSDIYVQCTSYEGLASVAPLLNKPDSTRYFIDQYKGLLDSIYTMNKQREITEIKDKHIVEIHDQQMRARNMRLRLGVGIFIVLLLSAFFITFLLIDRKRKKRYLQAQEELRQANVEVLRAQVDEQPADLDALYRKKLAACQNLFRRTPSARLLLVPPASLTAAQRQTLMDDLTRSFVDIMLDVKNASNAVNDQELMYCILSSLQCSTAQMAELLNTTESTLRSRKARLKEKMPDNLHALFLS